MQICLARHLFLTRIGGCVEGHSWWYGGGWNKREDPEKGVPYLPILPFNGCPLLAVGSVEIRPGGLVLLFGPFPHLQSSPQPGQEEEGRKA